MSSGLALCHGGLLHRLLRGAMGGVGFGPDGEAIASSEQLPAGTGGRGDTGTGTGIKPSRWRSWHSPGSASRTSTIAHPVVSSIVVLPAWALDRESTGSGRTASRRRYCRCSCRSTCLYVPWKRRAPGSGFLRPPSGRSPEPALPWRSSEMAVDVDPVLSAMMDHRHNGLIGTPDSSWLSEPRRTFLACRRGPASVRRHVIETTRLSAGRPLVERAARNRIRSGIRHPPRDSARSS